MSAAAAAAADEVGNEIESLQLRYAVEDTSAEAEVSRVGDSPRSSEACSCEVVDALEARSEEDDARGCEGVGDNDEASE